ncbi:hypothetical protein H5410_039043 [Solanum commersonii]|uniref:Serine hydroxymethyltransferase-like domain-containing protein n=1 Tax=Solanum commersonii TaxID=4109 RepID=A0A9J5YAR9_SOLCO|nr:hypothetical protein H5410_039043 [Solanum commersonii]
MTGLWDWTCLMGGHLSHGFMTPKRRVSGTSIYYESMPYRLDESSGLVNIYQMYETSFQTLNEPYDQAIIPPSKEKSFLVEDSRQFRMSQTLSPQTNSPVPRKYPPQRFQEGHKFRLEISQCEVSSK